LLGKSDIAPERSTERRRQFADTFVYTPPDVFRDHALEIGAELFVEAFNLANHRNCTGYDGVVRNATFGRPTNAAGPRVRAKSR
jgi:hypothetical protein